MEKSKKKLPAGWEMKKLKEIGVTQTGNTPATNDSDNWGDFIPFVKPAHFKIDGTIDPEDSGLSEQGLKSARLFNANSILMVCIGATIGKTGFTRIPVTSNQQINCLTPFQNFEPKFFYYALISDQFQQKVLRNASQATLPIINKSKWENLSVTFPTCRIEQQRIVAKLDEAFAEIATAKANIERNLQNCKEVFQCALTKELYPKKDWLNMKLKDVCSKITDGTHQTPKYFDEGFIFLSSRNVTSGIIDWNNIKYIDEKQHIEMQKRVSPQIGDILLAKNGTTGVAAVVDKDIPFDIYVSLALLRPLKIIDSFYFLHFVNSPIAKKQFNKRLKGIGVPNLHLEEIREVLIAFPKSLSEQNKIVERLNELKEQTEQLEQTYQQKLSSLEELKKSILNKAFCGEL